MVLVRDDVMGHHFLVSTLRRSKLFAVTATLAGLAIDEAMVATAPGAASSVPWPLAFAARVLVPLVAMLLLAGVMTIVPALLLGALSDEGEGRAWLLSCCVPPVASAALMYLAVGVVTPELRLRRLAHATAALAPAVERYAAARAAGRLTTPPPALGVRGCSALAPDAPGDGSWQLSATCPGWLGQPDELVYRPDGGGSSEIVRRLGGGWAYVWD